MLHHNNGGGKPRYREKHFANICDVCGSAVPDQRWKEVTCSDTCKRAKRTGRTRTEQFWRDYADDKVTI